MRGSFGPTWTLTVLDILPAGRMRANRRGCITLTPSVAQAGAQARKAPLRIGSDLWLPTYSIDERRVIRDALSREGLRRSPGQRPFRRAWEIDPDCARVHPGHQRYERKPGASCPVRATYSV